MSHSKPTRSSRGPAPPPRDEDQELAEALAFAYGDTLESAEIPPPAGAAHAPANERAWYPDLNPTQRLIFEDPRPFILGHGEKGSGKSIGFAHKIVRHAYETENALVLIIAPSMRTGNEGIWFDLENLVLPQWKEGIGLEYTDSKLDPNTKDRHRWVRNRFGGWSKLLLMSIPFCTQVQQRIKGPAPSMVYVDELTNCDGREYFTYPALQLGRRRAGNHGVSGPQQYCASCNPDGPSHWVYQVFFVDCVNEAGERDADYSVYHVPISENAHRLPEGYIEKLEKVLKGDPIELQRLRDGIWVDRPTGEGLFKEFFVPALHLKGDLVRGTGLRPKAGFPIILGYDLGQVYSSVTFEQLIPTKEKPIWIVFDEVDHLGKKILYKRLAWEVIERIHFWRKLLGYEFQTLHITDESAINQWRPGGEGSYDAWEFEREYNKVSAGLGGSQKKIKLRGCPKGEGSVAARVRLLQAKLFQEELFVSVHCKNTKEMLMFLEADPKEPENPKRSKFLHKFDSLTYPMFKLEVAGQKHALPTARVAPSLIRCGSGSG